MRHITVFATAIGYCGLAWGDEGLVGAQLPEADEDRTRSRLAHRFSGADVSAPPLTVRDVRDAIVALTGGEKCDLSFASLDLRGVSPFNLAVYGIARRIGFGETRTYGDIAGALGDKKAARAVGRALGENPWPIIVPCHRVLAAGGGIGGFSANGGVNTKARLLAIEGARTGEEPTLFDDACTISLAPRRSPS